MNKTVLTDEESRRLIELGVNAGEGTFFPHPDGEYWQGDECGDICFTLEDLLSILPKKITDRRDIYNLNIGVNSEDLWYAKYLNDHECWDSLNSYQDAHELCDCIYDMILWLKEKSEFVWL